MSTEPPSAADPDPIPVDSPDRGPCLPWTHRPRLLPVLPGWVRSWVTLWAAARWVTRYGAHLSVFHLVRFPLYVLRLAWCAPRGLARLLTETAAWVLDGEGRPLRAGAVAEATPDVYLRLVAERRRRVRLRLALLAVLVVLVVVAVLLAPLAPTWVRATAVTLVVAGLGWAGIPADAPLAGPAVIPHRVQRLTADVITRALLALGIAEINKTTKAGGGVSFPAPITRDGPGWRADIDLPHGVTAVDILDRRDRLASGLRRPVGCVWPEPARTEHAGRLVLWVGDHDMSQTRAVAWPLEKRGTTTLFEPVPLGQDPRGQLVSVPLMFSSVLIGAMPRQGKSFALRVLLLAAALDPLAELRVFDFKGTGDHGYIQKIAHHYASGAATPATLDACMNSLRQLVHDELVSRAETISRLPRDVCPESKVTPQLAAAGLGLHPIVIAVDEIQELFSHPDYRQEAEALCTALIKRGPALGIILILATQRPDRESLPTAISANVGVRLCLRVMGQVENDMVLGTSSYRAGIRATSFSAQDRGIGILIGASDEPRTVKCAYITAEAAEAVVGRAHAARAAAGTLTGHAIGDTTTRDEPVAVSLLADLVAVTRPEETKIWLEVLADRLMDLRPDIYRSWAERDGETKARGLSAALKPYGVSTSQVWGTTTTGKSANRRGIRRSDLLAAHRDTTTSGARHRAASGGDLAATPARPSRPTSNQNQPWDCPGFG
ncbi:FtsK/SpoIIIE domain-containing protein [Actinokineospora sp. NBRC 105648]|uniref:FtsK/SpoIIIE domain-containing protein n=1 Tax=Actinokineospora sp. NBRC 105648 TaxID=3032206 RepID=UPI0024A11998|nr:FtsK/SpoIIIE domain-containing protein [Actinokineospora sp. NBRC 105648]GLZ42804.1 cell division protein FtsK [Actinokineospora sp. NBRC 105648]